MRDEPIPQSGHKVLLTACVSTDDLQPALRTTLQLLGELGICSPDSSVQEPCLLEELRNLTKKKDLELHRCGAAPPPLFIPLPFSPSSLSFQLGCGG